MPTSANIWNIFLKVELTDLICDKRRTFFSLRLCLLVIAQITKNFASHLVNSFPDHVVSSVSLQVNHCVLYNINLCLTHPLPIPTTNILNK